MFRSSVCAITILSKSSVKVKEYFTKTSICEQSFRFTHSMNIIIMRPCNHQHINPQSCQGVWGPSPNSTPMGCDATGRMTQKNAWFWSGDAYRFRSRNRYAVPLQVLAFFSLCCPKYRTPFRTVGLVADRHSGV